MLEIYRVQRPVGQGGFHTAELAANHARFRYIYDCGSTQKDLCSRELSLYVEELPSAASPLDLLTLSHLDEDHVGGVEELLASRNVEVALLPYLHPWERLILVAEACERGNLTESRFALLSSPAAWLRRRGVQRVVFVLPPDIDDPDAGFPRLPDNLPPLKLRGTEGFTLKGPRELKESDVALHDGLPEPRKGTHE